MNQNLSVIEKIDTHRESVYVLSKNICNEKLMSCINELNAIDIIENNYTIESLQTQSKYAKLCSALVKSLDVHNINCMAMTIPEAKNILEFASNKSPEIREEKAIEIHNNIVKILNGIRHRRDYTFDKNKEKILENLNAKYERYERGEMDMSRSFDVSIYPKKEHEYILAYDAYKFDFYIEDCFENDIEISEYEKQAFTKKDKVREFENLLSIMTDEELLDGGYIDEEDFFVFGPYTKNDCENIVSFMNDTYVGAMDKRDKAKLGNLLSDILRIRSVDIETDLLENYISRTVLTARRPTARQLIILVSNFSKHLLVEFSILKEHEPDFFEKIKSKLVSCSRLMRIICSISEKQAKEKYDKINPICEQFYDDVLDVVDNWCEEKAEDSNSSFHTYCMKLDDNLLQLESYYKTLINKVNRKTKNENNQLLLGGLLK